jgi:hypothetical protein
MAKQSQLDRAIQELENQREVIDAALAVLTNLRVKAPRRPRVVKKADEKTA